MNDISFAAVLKDSRRKAGLSQKELAAALGVTRNTVVNWEADKCRPDYSAVPALCRVLNIPLHALFAMDPEPGLSPLESRVVGNLRRLGPAARRLADKAVQAMADEEAAGREAALRESYRLFVVRPGAAAAGTGFDTADALPSRVFLRKTAVNAGADGIVLVRGRSMEPAWHDGDYVYYRNAETARPGEDVIVDTDDGAVIKRVDGHGALFSVNPAFPYPPKYEGNTLAVRGKVLGPVEPADRPAPEDAELLEEVFAEEIRRFRETHRLWDDTEG